MWESVVLVLAALTAIWQSAHTPVPNPVPQPSLTTAQVMALQTADLKAPIASALGERAVVTAAAAQLQAFLGKPFDAVSDEELPAALEAMALFRWDASSLRPALLQALSGLSQKTVDYQRAVLTGAHTLFWQDAAPQVMAVLPQINTPKEFAIGANTVLRASDLPPLRAELRSLMLRQFPQWDRIAQLIALERRLRPEPANDLAERPALSDLLRAPIKPGYPVVYSLQRHNRAYPGLALVRGADGRFVRRADLSLFAVSQLAMAKSRLPGTITNGNTPQGLFVIKGTVSATNVWIGPTPALQSKLPIEASRQEFEHLDPGLDSPVNVWDESQYWSYFPKSWQGFAPLREAWLAGLAGRDEIWLHGDTVNPDYYRNTSYFPFAPSAGCMVAIETWSKEDGTLLQSDQLNLVKALATTGSLQAYLVVVNIDDRQLPVALADVYNDIFLAEAQ